MEKIEKYLNPLSKVIAADEQSLKGFLKDLKSDGDFLSALQGSIENVPEFEGTVFRDPEDLRVYRILLYLATRQLQPERMVETGVLNGIGTSFILLGLHHNGKGELHSVDIPPDHPKIQSQGTNPLPEGKEPGWIIPTYLRKRHHLHLGFAQRLLPELFLEFGSLDIFVHDSDHSYAHMMFELSLAWEFLRKGGVMICDNVEQNQAFGNFSSAHQTESKSEILASFDQPDRVWKHGVMKKTDSTEFIFE